MKKKKKWLQNVGKGATIPGLVLGQGEEEHLKAADPEASEEGVVDAVEQDDLGPGARGSGQDGSGFRVPQHKLEALPSSSKLKRKYKIRFSMIPPIRCKTPLNFCGA